jgi:hypothetical protein
MVKTAEGGNHAFIKAHLVDDTRRCVWNLCGLELGDVPENRGSIHQFRV